MLGLSWLSRAMRTSTTERMRERRRQALRCAWIVFSELIALAAGRLRRSYSRYATSSRRPILPPAPARAAATRGTADPGWGQAVSRLRRLLPCRANCRTRPGAAVRVHALGCPKPGSHQSSAAGRAFDPNQPSSPRKRPLSRPYAPTAGQPRCAPSRPPPSRGAKGFCSKSSAAMVSAGRMDGFAFCAIRGVHRIFGPPHPLLGPIHLSQETSACGLTGRRAPGYDATKSARPDWLLLQVGAHELS